MKEETINRTNIVRHLIEYELEMVGKTILMTLDNDKWYFNFTMTQNQFVQYKSYAIPLLKKVFKFNKRKAESTFTWYWKTFGLRIKN